MLCHRLITARFGEYRDPVLYPEKIRKDLKQAALVTARIQGDEDLESQLKTIVGGLSEDLRGKLRKAANEATDHVRPPDLTLEDAERILTVAEKAIN